MKTFSKFVEAKEGYNLWLDDIVDPATSQGRAKGAIGDEIWVKTVEEAMKYIQTGMVKHISFDNDLGQGQKEGWELARDIMNLAGTGRIRRIGWNIHSSNSSAAQNILSKMKQADRAWDEQENQQT